MTDAIPFRRVLIVADDSADWTVAGLRQLDRLALTVDEFAVENRETTPALICIFWRPDVDPLQRWIPKYERLTRVTFAAEPDGQPYDVVLTTRLFLYRGGMSRFIETSASSAGSPIVFTLGMESWQENFRWVESLPHFSKGGWEYIPNWDQIDAIERRFLRNSGKSQDGPVSRYLNRPVSRAVTRMLLRFPTTPNGWTWLIFPIPIVAALVLCQGTYGSFVWGMVLFQIFSVLDGCDGEIARAKFMESEKGRRLDEVFDILSNIFLVLGVGFGLSAATRSAGHSYGLIWAIEGIVAALLIGANEFNLISKNEKSVGKDTGALADKLYPRHRNLVERSGMLRLGEGFAHWVMQLTKHDVALLFFLVLAIVGWPSLILHLMFAVTAVTLALAARSN